MKVSILKFLECMYPLIDPDNRFSYNKIAFRILDIDRDQGLNILNLMQLQKKLDPRSRIGKDIFKMI